MSESSSFMKERNDAFNNEVHFGPMKNDYSIRVDDPKGIAFEATQGITRKEFEDQNRKAVDDLFKEPEEIGSVFETREKKLEEKALSHEKNEVKPTSNNNNNGIDPNAVDALKKLSDQEKGMKEPSVESSLGFIK